MIIADMHSHSDFSGDCKIPLTDMIAKAKSLGLNYYAITDHHDLEFPECGINFELDLDSYMEHISAVSNSMTSEFTLLKGVEFGLQPSIGSTLDGLATKYDFDFIIGSSHLANGKDPYQKDFYEGLTRNEGYKMYFEATLDNINSTNAFDTLGHLDYAIRYWRGDDHRKYDYKDFQEIFDAILKTLIKKGKSLEVNTSGYLQKLDQPNPSYDVLTHYHQLGGELITIGSDAHLPQNIMSNFDLTEKKLRQIGFKSYTIYKQRQPIQLDF